MTIVNKFSEWFVYATAWLVTETHLDWFIIPISIVLTFVATCVTSCCLNIFGVHDSFEDDKKLLGLSKDNDKNENIIYDKHIKIY